MNRLAIALCVAMVLLARPFGEAAVPPEERPATTAPSSGDAGTDLVAAFYEALLQDKPPTREQELALFPAESWVRMVLALKPEDYQDEGTEPMTRTPEQKENLRQRLAKVAAAGPVALTYFRKHKDWFLPKNMAKRSEIQLTSTFHFLRSLDRMKDPPKPGYGTVLALFVDDRAVPPGQARLRTVVFQFSSGKLNPEEIQLDGYQGKYVEQRMPEEGDVP